MNKNLAVGYIFAVKGLKGEVKIKQLTSKQRFLKNNILQVNPPLEEHQALTVEKVYHVKNNLVVKFEEINNYEEAEKIKNHYLEVERTILPSGTYYTDDLIGLNVITDKGEKLGIVDSVYESKAHDILSVKGKKNIGIPVIGKYIQKIDLINNMITVKEVKGLLES